MLGEARHAVDRQSQEFGDAELGLHRAGLGRVADLKGGDASQLMLPPRVLHGEGIGEVGRADPQPLRDMGFGLTEPHPSSDLQARHQISGSAHPAHPRGRRVSTRHPERVAASDLQAVEPQNVDGGPRRSRHGVQRQVARGGHAADAHPDVHVDGDLGDLHAGLDQRERASDVPGPGLAGVDGHRRAVDGRAGLLHELHLRPRPEAGEAHAAVLEQAVHAEDELAGHADLDAHVGVPGADLLDGEQRGQEVAVAGRAGGVEVDAVRAGRPHGVRGLHHVLDRVLDSVLLRLARLLDAGLRQQLRPVGRRPVGARIQTQVGHGAVHQRHGQHRLGVLHVLRLERQDGPDGLERVVDVSELDGVGPEHLLVDEQVLRARADHFGARAVVGEHDLVADVHGGEPGRRRPDLEQMVELRLRQWRHLGAFSGGPCPLLELRAEPAAGHVSEPAVTQARRQCLLHLQVLPVPVGASGALRGVGRLHDRTDLAQHLVRERLGHVRRQDAARLFRRAPMEVRAAGRGPVLAHAAIDQLGLGLAAHELERRVQAEEVTEGPYPCDVVHAEQLVVHRHA